MNFERFAQLLEKKADEASIVEEGASNETIVAAIGGARALRLVAAVAYQYAKEEKAATNLSYNCALRGCKNRADLWVNEDIGDACYRQPICRFCADAIGVQEDDTLPDPDVVHRKLKHARSKS